MSGDMKTSRLVSGPLIARLLDCHRDSVNEAMLAGRYGPTFVRDRIRYADLRAVEKAIGIQFSEKQIEHATEGQPGRVLRVPDHNQKEITHGRSR